MASAAAGPSHPPREAAPQWRQFTFFDAEQVTDPDAEGAGPKALRDLTPPILLAASTPDSPLPPCLIVASGQTISVLDREYAVVASWVAWEGNGRPTAILERAGLLVAIGDEDGSRCPVLKIWDLTREERKRNGGGPVLMRNVKIQHGQRPHPVSAVALTSTLSHLAVGLGDGTVLLYRHLLQSLNTAPTNLTSMPKARAIHESPEPVTGLGFCEGGLGGDESSSAPPSLFIVTINRVLSASVSSRGGEPKVLDEQGAGLGCAAMDWARRELVVARDEAVYVYNTQGRGETFAYEGPKSTIAVFRNNLVITSPPFIPSAGAKSATVRHYVSKNGSDASTDIAKITVFDMRNKIISYSGTFRDGVRDVFFQWGGVYVFGGNGKLSRLEEHATQAKLETLHKRNMYTLAIGLAENSGMREGGVADIHKRYGDYLYDKGDYDGAMAQYVLTLGHLQPSYVIRKFLDAQRIPNLTTYLQALHSHGLANPDHTTLLLNCYTKTADHAALDAFLRSETHREREADGEDGADDLPFDLDTAIRVCRQAGFFDHATYLAKRYGRHEEYLRIQIEDAEKWGEALSYLRGLGPEACRDNMMLYGRTLLQHVPEETTALLIDLCSGTLGKEPPKSSQGDGKAANGSSGPAVLSYLGYNRVAGMFTSEPQASSPVESTDAKAHPDRAGSKISQRSGTAKERDTTGTTVANGSAPSPAPAYDPPSPRQYFAHFAGRQDLFIHFLEAVALTLWGQRVDAEAASSGPSSPVPPAYMAGAEKGDGVDAEESAVDQDQRAVWNTLLELYLASMRSGASEVSGLARGKALGLLASALPVDVMHALLLCSTAGFTEGTVRIWEKLGMYEDVLRFYMDAARGEGDKAAGSVSGDKVFRALELYGPEHPHLYSLVLGWVTGSAEVLERHGKEMPRLLQEIDERRVMPALAVVQVLSRNGVASVGHVKEWLREKVAENKQDIESDKSLVHSYRSETASRRAELVSLSSPRAPETFSASRCAACGAQLDLPAVHFMCKHSFHQRCLADADPECTLCARQHAIIREVRRNQTRLAGRHELFVDEVQEAEDGFAVLAGGFGRGLMGLRVE